MYPAIVFALLVVLAMSASWWAGGRSGREIVETLTHELARIRLRNAQLEAWIDEGRYAAAKIPTPAPPASSVHVGPAPELPDDFLRELERIEDAEVQEEYREAAAIALRGDPNLRGADLLAHIGLEPL